MGPAFNPLAIVSMILGILSIPGCCCWILSGPFAAAAIVLGVIAMNKIRNNPQSWKGDGMAIAGIVTGGIGVLLSVAAIFSTVDDTLRSRLSGGF